MSPDESSEIDARPELQNLAKMPGLSSRILLKMHLKAVFSRFYQKGWKIYSCKKS